MQRNEPFYHLLLADASKFLITFKGLSTRMRGPLVVLRHEEVKDKHMILEPKNVFMQWDNPTSFVAPRPASISSRVVARDDGRTSFLAGDSSALFKAERAITKVKI